MQLLYSEKDYILRENSKNIQNHAHFPSKTFLTMPSFQKVLSELCLTDVPSVSAK